MDESSGVRSALLNMRTVSAVLVVALIAGILVWLLKSNDALAAMSLRVEAGSVRVLHDGKPVSVDKSYSLSAGDVISTAPRARALLRLEGARRLELAGSSEIKVLDGARIESLKGNVLADTHDRMKVMVGDVAASASSAVFRVDNAVGSARAGVYFGSISVDGPGSAPLNVGALYQTSITGTQVLERDPYALDETDSWDRSRIGNILNVNDELDKAKRGFALQLGGSRPDLAYFDALTTDNVSFMKPYVTHKQLRSAGFTSDLMVGFMIATHAPGDAAKAFDRAYQLFFEEDATWGVVAGIVTRRDAERMDQVLADLRAAYIGTGVLAGSTGAQPSFTAAAPGSGQGGKSGSSSGSGGGTGNTGSGAPPPAAGGPDPGGHHPITSNPGNGGGGDPGNGGGDPGNGGGGDPGNGGGGGCNDVECQVEKIIPSPPPGLEPPPLHGGG